jgi:deoxyadenosine/deoxycytidine kinase
MAKSKMKHIAIAGNIGAGKSSLTELLAKHYKWKPHYEDVEENPYLSDFYDDMTRWSFNLQIYFLNSRIQQLIKIQEGKETVIQDRTIYEDAFIFAPNLHAMNLMSTRDFDNYQSLFKTISSKVSPPDLLIYLQANIPTLVNNIQNRARDYEENIRIDYLKKLNAYYESWIETYKNGKLLVINVDNLDFLNNKEDLAVILEKVDKEVNGLF